MAAYEFWRVGVEYTAGTVTDITQYVDTVRGPISATTGATQETTGEPASLSLVLNNTGLRFTSGSLALQTGMKIQFWETIGYSTFYLFTGYIEFPEIDDANVSSTQDQQIQVYAVDQLARWERSGTYVSTLTAHIAGSSRNSVLKGYWPLLDASAPLAPAVGTIYGTISKQASSTRSIEQQAAVEFNGAPALPGDDVLGLKFIPGLAGGTPSLETMVAKFTYPIVPVSSQLTIPSGQVLTAVLWLNQDLDVTTDADLNLSIIYNSGGGSGLLNLIKTGTNWRTLYFDGSSSFVTSTATTSAIGRWYQIAMRWGFNPNVLEIWVDDQAVVAGTFATVVTDAYTTGGSLSLSGSAAHVQFYVGPAADFTNADFLAQRDVGLRGLELQRTASRINSLANYAGFPTAARDISYGASVMQRASLAGLTVADAMDIARQTEQGDLFVSGDGRLVFRDRPYINNV